MKSDLISQKLFGYVLKPESPKDKNQNSSALNTSNKSIRPVTAANVGNHENQWVFNCIRRPRHVSSVIAANPNKLPTNKEINNFLTYIFKERKGDELAQPKPTPAKKGNFIRPRTASCSTMNNIFKASPIIKSPSALVIAPNSSQKESFTTNQTDIEDKKVESPIVSKLAFHRINLDSQVRKTLRIKDANDDGTLEDYFIGSEIGKGAYAVVKLGISKANSKKVAIKVYEKITLLDSNKKKNVQREIRILSKLNHPSIVKLYETIETPRSINLILEYVPGCSLQEYVKRRASRRLEEGEARKIFKQIMEGIAYFHSKNISHRDIKLENVLIDQNQQIKLIDFGFGVYIPETRRVKLFCGTPSYMAPEIVMKKEHLSQPADIWAAGVLLYVLLAGIFPFRAPHHKELYQKIQKGSFSMPENISLEAKHLIHKMLNYDPQQRISAGNALQEPWLQMSNYESKKLK
ncbi:unnamed protein product [Blepharisma stoltei]|uniref:Protein kinase domain-containing protein n=1 Tax=Blepharisma stoltei TaxID=1481888 RepID=A0AAU9J0I2_9CILI|nr:unnamed protein product [Blepharisma stoltei]